MFGIDVLHESHKRWLTVTTILAIALIAGYLLYNSQMVPRGGTTPGLIIGIASLLLILFLGSYSARKYIFIWWKGTSEEWLKCHLYLGFIAVLLVLMHAGFRLAGHWSTLVFILLGVVVVSGSVGLWMYAMIPRALSKFETLMFVDELMDAIDELTERIDKLVREKSDGFREFYSARTADEADAGALSGRWFRKPSKVSTSKDEWLEGLGQSAMDIPEQERDDLQQMIDLLWEKKELESQFAENDRLDMLRRSWLTTHACITSGLFMAILVHLVSVFYY